MQYDKSARNSVIAISGIRKSAVGRMLRIELVPAIFLVSLGVGQTIASIPYSLGTFQRLGAGALPAALGVLTAVLGLIIIANVLVAGETGSVDDEVDEANACNPFSLRIVGMVSVAILAWGLTVEALGLVPATFALVAFSAAAEKGFRLVSIVVLALAISVVGYLIFIVGLGLPISALRWS